MGSSLGTRAFFQAFGICGDSVVALALCTAHASGGGVEDETSPKPENDFTAHIDEVHEHTVANSLPRRGRTDIALNLPFEFLAAAEVPCRGKFLLFHGFNY